MKRIAILLAVAACGGSSSRPPASAPPAREATGPTPQGDGAGRAPAANDAVVQAALAEQYDAGKRIYVEKKCATCHGDRGEGNPKNPPVIGSAAFPEAPPPGAKLRTMPFETAADVLAFVKAKMPLKQPGTLTDDEAAAVTAWMLSESKAPIERPLDAANAASVPLR